MKRRDFLRVPIVSATAGTLLNACAPGSDQIIPILIPEEDFIPGVESWHETTCPLCESHCGIRVRKVDGRLVKVEGNPEHVVSRGGVCPAGQTLPQLLYHPDRLTGPRIRRDETFEPAEWDRALDALDAALTRASTTDDRPTLGIISGCIDGLSGYLLEQLAAAWGPSRLWRHRRFERGAERRALNTLTDKRGLMSFPLAEMKYVLSLGEEFLSGSGAVWGAKSLTTARHATPGSRAKWVSASPRLSMSGASADEWIPLAFGSEAWLTLAINKRLLESERADLGSLAGVDGLDEFARWLQALPPDTLSTRCDVTPQTIDRLAREMAEHRPAIAVMGPSPFDHGDQPPAQQAVMFLNALLGNFGSEGLVAVESESANSSKWESLDSTLAQPSWEALPQILLIVDSDPLYGLPKERFKEFADRIPFIAKIGSFVDDSASICDLLLPESTVLERWDGWRSKPLDRPGGRRETLGISRPLIARALYDSRSLGEIVHALVQRVTQRGDSGASLEDSPALSRPNDESRLRDFVSRVQPSAAQGAAWDELRANATSSATSASQHIDTFRFDFQALDVALSAQPSTQRAEDLVLMVYPSPVLGDGRLAHLPFLQELADPVTGTRWTSVVELNPRTAAGLGIEDGDTIHITTAFGEGRARARVLVGIRPDIVAIASGQGHEDYTRYATGRGLNAFRLLDPHSATTPVTLSRVGDAEEV